MSVKVPKTFVVTIEAEIAGHGSVSVKGRVYGHTVFDAMDNMDEGEWSAEDLAALESIKDMELSGDGEKAELVRSLAISCKQVAG